MAGTNVYNVHYSVPLANLNIDYHPAGLIAEEILPVVPVQHESDKYYVFNREDKFRTTDDVIPDGSRAKLLDFGWTTAGYVTTPRGFEVRITDRERDNADDILKLEMMKVRGAQDIIMLNQEIRIAALMATAANYAASNTLNVGAVATNQWNNASFTGSIETIFDNADEAVRVQLGGLIPNMMILPKAVAKVVKRDAKIRDLIKYTHSDLITDGDLPAVLWGKRVFVPAAASSSSIEGGASQALADVWGKHAWLLYRTDHPTVGTVNFGYIFRVKSLSVKTWRQEEIDATFYRPSYNQTEKIVSQYAGYFLQNVIA